MVTIICTKCGRPDAVTEYQANVKKCLHCHKCIAA